MIEPKGNLNPSVIFYKVDITDPSAVASVAKRIRTEHGDPTVLINNAGIGNSEPLLKLTEPKIRKVFDVNIIAPIVLVQEFLPSMVRQNHGHIVNIASMASFIAQASNVDYCCTKSAMLSFHEGLAQELRLIYKSPQVRTRTPLIEKLTTGGKLKDPSLSPDEVAIRVVDALYSGYGAQMVIPENLGWTSLIRGLPGWMQESLRDTVSIGLLKSLGQYE
ncbi:hypothetical protein G7Z17_g901 [Cylindrodendrum hubeiense]|uniref:Uncharacterized protein n=1 Tax=Cylindrodendrum hubeiense TaxID=595255 RepID=A0A9P5LFS9_9HYPO|nr:hypothetical protein G7Z17_g901 [Cylindrodendrum hubeiense]